MRMSWRTLGLLIALIVAVAVISIWLTLFIQDRSLHLSGPAAPLTEPVMKDIAADRGWQNTGILLEADETIHIQFMSGEIRDGDTVIRGPAGAGWVCGDSTCCEPMPTVERDALIGRVGDMFFSIGDRNRITISTGGELRLRINDCDAGLFDNSGRLTVKISH